MTDQQNLNQVRGTYFAYGISLDLSCDPQGSVDTWTSCAEFPDQEAQLVYEYRENELTLAGVVKEDLACSGSSLPEKRKKKYQAASSKQRLTMVQGSCRMYIERYNYGQ